MCRAGARPRVRTSLFEDPAAGLHEDASAGLPEHPALLSCLILGRSSTPSSVGCHQDFAGGHEEGTMAITESDRILGTLRRGQVPNDAPMSCQGFLDSCSARRLVICWARCSALARDRPVVVMTLRLPRRSRMSQVRPGGRPRELVEPVSIWTVTGGTADHFRGLARGRVRWAGGAGVAGLRTRQGGAAPGGGQALIRSRPAGQMGSGDGRRIVRRPARMRQPNIGPGRPRGSGGQPAAARRWG